MKFERDRFSSSAPPAAVPELGALGVMRASVRFTFSLFVLSLLAAACGRHEESADAKVQNQLPGVWVSDAQFASGHVIHSTITIAPDGSYLTRMDIPARTNGPQIVNVAGTFRMKDGFLIDTLTNYSDTNINPANPITSRARIIRIDGRELRLDYETNTWSVYPTNPTVFRRQIK